MTTKVKIVTDGSCDLPQSILDQLEIASVDLTVRFGEEEYKSNLDTNLFYSKMKQYSELPKTAAPSPYDFLQAYSAVEDGRDILVVALSKNLSSTYNHAVMAKDQLLEEGFSGKVDVIDAKTTSLGLGLIVVKAARMAKEGKSFEEIVQQVNSLVVDSKTLFVLETLENVVKGGRLDRFRGTVATVLNIKLFMQASEEGTLELVEKVRGSKNAIKRMIDKVSETVIDESRSIIAVAHSNCEEKAQSIIEEIRSRYPFKEVISSNMGPVIGTYAGEGTVLISY